MFHTPSIGSHLDLERQREMLTQAGQQRPVRQLREHASAAGAQGGPAKAHPPSRAPRMNHTAAASSHPNWGDPSWPH